MKKHYLLIISLLSSAAISFSQQTITSVQSGNASNPFTWDCLCFPSTDDHVIINHNVTMDVDWLINNGGSITVNSGKSLMQSGTHALAIDGAGSALHVSGTFLMENVSLTNSASVNTSSSGTINIEKGLYISANSSYQNVGKTAELDSLLTQGTFTNIGSLFAGDVLNTGDFTTSGSVISDSVGNTGTFNITSGYIYSNAFGTSGTASFSNGLYHTMGNFYNSGDLSVGSGFTIETMGSFYSGDTLGGVATFAHDGLLTVSTNIYFTDDISGSGNICVSGDSYNSGNITGTLNFCDATGGNFDFDMGTIAGTVTFCTPACYAGLTEDFQAWSVYPNPATNQVKLIGADGINSVQVYGISGQLIGELDVNYGSLDVSKLDAGTYFILPVSSLILSPIRLTVE